MTLLSSFLFYISDNLVWFANMGIIGHRTTLFSFHLEWRGLKDVIALWKNLIELVKYAVDALRNFWRQHDLITVLSKMEEHIVSKSGRGPTSYEMLRELISLRSKMRFIIMGTLQNLLRITMLTHRLRFPLAHEWIHPIGVCVCGIASNIIAIAKLFREKKMVIQLRKAGKAPEAVDG